MKKKALLKSVYREIFESKARFLSILGIILLGVCFYAGIKATGPNMNNTASHYFQEQQLMDSRLISTMGLTKEDLALLETDPNIEKVQATYSKDVNMSNLNRVIKFYGYDLQAKDQLNQYRVIEGRLPEKNNEIALDNLAAIFKDYKIGDTFKIAADKQVLADFKLKEYTVVGFVNSPMFIENMSRGTTTVGKGSIDYFAVLPVENFQLDYYSEVFLTYKNTRELLAYTPEYEKAMEANTKELKNLFQDRPQKRLGEIKKEAEKPLNEAREKLKEGEAELAKAKKELAKGREDLTKGERELANARALYLEKIAAGENELWLNNQKLAEGKQTLEVESGKLASGRQKLDQSKVLLDQGAAELQAQGIDPNTNVAELQGQQSELIELTKLAQNLATDITQIVAAIEVGERIPEKTLNSWLASLSNYSEELADLGDVEGALALVGSTPMTEEIKSLVAQAASRLPEATTEINQQLAQLEELIKALSTYQAGLQEYQAGENQYQAGLAQLAAAKTELANGQVALDQGYRDLEQGRSDGQAQLAQGENELAEAGRKLLDGEKKLKESAEKLKDGQKELADKEAELAKIEKPTYYFFDREDTLGYAEYHENSNRLSSIATVFPVFFFMIAALVSLTTMTRMVDEKRGEIGTLKALGYSNGEIALKYIVYATAASLIGAGLGLIIGFNVFPKVIIDAYGSLYNIPQGQVIYYLSYSLQSLIVALMCTLISAMVVLRFDLFSTPAILMRPKAPKAGQRIFLERLTFIWKRLNFNQKVTFRNLFRYKQRMFMTVFGIAGCMALIITGFGLRDSISDVVDIQFSKLWHYQGIVTYQEETTKEAEQVFEKAVEELPALTNRLVIAQQSMEIRQKGKTTQTVTVDTPEDVSMISKFVLFNNRKTGEVYQLDDQGVLINEKLAKMFDLKKGDTFELTTSDNQKYPVKIANIIENYAMHFVYMTPTYYESVFNKLPDFNSELLLFDGEVTEKQEDQISEGLMALDKVVNVSFLTTTSNAMDDTIDSLNIVVWVLIISAASLAFIVLYNLTNINISERIRELSTIKVLGFYNNEVTMYVYRENNILTILGIVVGCFVGKLLHTFVLSTAEVDMLMFSPTIHKMSYVYSALLTLFFSFVVMLVMHRKLRKVDMIEALKSTE